MKSFASTETTNLFGVTADQVRAKRAELDCSLNTAATICQKDAAESIVTRKYLMGEDVSDEQLWEVLTWLIRRA